MNLKQILGSAIVSVAGLFGGCSSYQPLVDLNVATAVVEQSLNERSYYKISHTNDLKSNTATVTGRKFGNPHNPTAQYETTVKIREWRGQVSISHDFDVSTKVPFSSDSAVEESTEAGLVEARIRLNYDHKAELERIRRASYEELVERQKFR